MTGTKCCVWALNNTLKCHVRCLQEPLEIIGTSSGIFGNVRKSLEHLRKSSAMLGSHLKFFGNPGDMVWKITRIWIRKVGRYNYAACVTRLQIENFEHTHWREFLTPDSQFRTTCSLTINMKNSIQFPPKIVQWTALNVLFESLTTC